MENKDYIYWREYYLLHASTKAFAKKEKQATEIIEEFLSLQVPSYGSVSGGKDSTAMLHLLWRVDPNIKLMSEKDDLDFPCEIAYMDALKELYDLNLDIIKPNVSLYDELLKHDFTEDIHSRGVDFSDEHFYKLIRKWRETNGYKGTFLGLRAEESKGRRWNLKTNNYIYYHASERQMICQPIANWSGKDVFAYLFLHEIPILDIYFKTNFVESPEQIRKSWVVPSHQSSRGQALWLKYYYPEIFTKLAEINAKMRAYV